RANSQGIEEAAPLPGVRQGVHAGFAARRHDGFHRRGVCRLLRLWSALGNEADGFARIRGAWAHRLQGLAMSLITVDAARFLWVFSTPLGGTGFQPVSP